MSTFSASRHRARLPTSLTLVLLTAIAAASGRTSDEQEYALFRDGGLLAIVGATYEDGRVRLSLPDGGELVVPWERIDSVVRGLRRQQDPVPPAEDLEEYGPEHASLVERVARRHGVDPDLVEAVIAVESGFDPLAVSRKGAIGLMQLMPGTAADYGVDDPFDPEQNVDGGVRLLDDLLDRYEFDVELALAAYNAGPGAVRRHGGVPPYPETRAYVEKVLALYTSD